MKVTIVIATCGSEEWKELGDRAMSDVQFRFHTPVIRVHLPEASVSEARNVGLEQVRTEYVCFLDADDSLEWPYFNFIPEHDVTATSITYQNKTAPLIPKVWAHEQHRSKYHRGHCSGDCLPDGNWVHIGAIIRTEAIKAIGGFKEWPVYEDWALFLELQQSGFTFGRRQESVYKATVRDTPGHRNQSLPLREKNLIHEDIYEKITGKKYEN